MPPLRDWHSAALAKIGGRLQLELARRGGRALEERVSATVVFTGPLDALRRSGFDAPSMVHHPVDRVNIAAGTVELARLRELAALESVVSIESAFSLAPEIDDSAREIGARQLHQGVGFLPALKGTGVVIGVIDTGFDIRHRSFQKPDGTTRIIALWDHTIGPIRNVPNSQDQLKPGESTPGGPFNYGVEYLRPFINDFLADVPGAPPVRSKDPKNHGTGVLGIAASNGRQPGNCHFAGHFVGVAPEADLILVAVRSTSQFQNSIEAQHAFEYIFNHPLVQERPTVVNFSQGDSLGPHDGTSALEKAIDALVLSRPGRVVVKSAGNEADSGRHAEVPVPVGPPVSLELRVVEEDNATQRIIEAWYPGTARLEVTVTAPLNPRVQVGPRAAGAASTADVINPGAPEDEQSRVGIASVLNAPNNGKNQITITLTSNSRLPAGPWVIQLRNTGAADTTAQVWLDRETENETRFTSHVSRARTITTPGTAEQVITVGAHAKGKDPFSGDLGSFSSRGPIDPSAPDKTLRTAPDVVAPGIGITSTKHGDHETSCCECCVNAYKGEEDNTGTSVAAPHVTGVVALMLQRHPRLTASDVRQLLRGSADRHRSFSGPRGDDELNSYGFGRVNAIAALQKVPPFFGNPAPGGTTPEPRPRSGPAPPDVGSGGGSPRAGAGPCAAVAGFAPFRTALAALRRDVLCTADGQLCAALVSRHFSEARGLIRSNRRVAVAWHRVGGPAFLRGVMHALLARGSGAPAASPAPDFPASFARFLDALERYGSDGLRSDLRRYRDEIAPLFRRALQQLRVLETVA